MRIAILIISTGKYNILSESLIQSVKKYLGDSDIYLFTDEKRDDVKCFRTENAEWPFVRLKRFETLREIYKSVSEYDLILYLDADMEIVSDIPDSIFELLSSRFIGVSHPANFIHRDFWPVETNNSSTAYLNPEKVGTYCQGCLWGAASGSFEEMNETLRDNVQKDINSGLVAVWHDESHLNKFFFENSKDLKILSPSFAYPENWNLNVDRIIIHKDKNMIDYPRFQGIGNFGGSLE